MNGISFVMSLVCLASCASSSIYSYPPESVEVTYTLSGWPQNRVDVVVTDTRPADQKFGDPTAAVKRLFMAALSRPMVNAGERNWLRVSVTDLVAKRESNRWKATAAIDAELTDTWGKVLRKVHGSSSFSKADINGTKTAEQCIDEAFRAAVLEALKQLDQEAM